MTTTQTTHINNDLAEKKRQFMYPVDGCRRKTVNECREYVKKLTYGKEPVTEPVCLVTYAPNQNSIKRSFGLYKDPERTNILHYHVTDGFPCATSSGSFLVDDYNHVCPLLESTGRFSVYMHRMEGSGFKPVEGSSPLTFTLAGSLDDPNFHFTLVDDDGYIATHQIKLDF